VVVKLASLNGLLDTSTLVPAASIMSVSLDISGVPLALVMMFSTSIVSAIILFVTIKSFSTVTSLLNVAAGVTTTPLESLESNVVPVNVKLPNVAGCTALSANAPCALVAASVIP